MAENYYISHFLEFWNLLKERDIKFCKKLSTLNVCTYVFLQNKAHEKRN